MVKINKKKIKPKNKAQAAEFTKEEIQNQLKGIEVERLNRQRKYHSTVIDYALAEQEAIEWDKEISDMKKEKRLSTYIQYGRPISLEIMECKLRVLVFNYKSLYESLNYLKQSLINDGFTDKEIEEIGNGRIIKMNKNEEKQE